LLNFHNYIIDKGFVKNYDLEFKKNHILLLCQNSLSTKNKFISKDKVWDFHSVHGRILDALRNGICIVAHIENTKSMPELINGYNCLVGKSSYELAKCISSIYYNSSLRKKLIINGKKSLNFFYNENKNFKKIERIILNL
jgi:hypothetical protein